MRWLIKTMEYLVNFLFFEGKKALTVEQKFILTKFGPVALRRSVMAAALWSKTFWFFKMISAPCIARLDVVAIMPSFVESCTPKIWLHCLELEVVSVLLQLVFNQFCLVNTKYIMIRSIYVETIDHMSILSVVNSMTWSSKRFGENDSRHTGISQLTSSANQSPLFMQQPMGRG